MANKDLRISVIGDPTEDSLKLALSDGYLVIVPVLASELHNPDFQPSAQSYHMLVLRGYTQDGDVITNDPGAKNGEGYLSTWTTLIGAIHDWNNGDAAHGDKAAILVGKYKIVDYDKKVKAFEATEDRKQLMADEILMKAQKKAKPTIKKIGY